MDKEVRETVPAIARPLVNVGDSRENQGLGCSLGDERPRHRGCVCVCVCVHVRACVCACAQAPVPASVCMHACFYCGVKFSVKLFNIIEEEYVSSSIKSV